MQHTVRFDMKVYSGIDTSIFVGLQFLWDAGYVLRDISIGNLILCGGVKGSSACKLSDLEYAKIYQPGAYPLDEATPQRARTVCL